MRRARFLAWFAACVTACGMAWTVPSAHRGLAAPSHLQTGAPDYWHTSGNRIVDSQGRSVRIAAVNWFGIENRYHVPDGLQKQPLDAILTRVRDLGFNAIRLTFSNESIEKNPAVTQRLDANPELKGLHTLDILDRIVASAGQHGLRIILDDSRSTVGQDPEENGLWYTKQYPERSWIRDWRMLARRYKGNATVVAVDLRNEPHTRPPGPWSLYTYLSQGATWGPYRGVDNRATDWRLAAERGGNAVLTVNPNLLIIVEGIQQYPDSTQPRGVDTSWWAGILQPARLYPVRLKVQHQLVYSPHEYGPYKYAMSYFGKRMSYRGLSAVWTKHWAFFLDSRFRYEAPIFVGEFGTCGSSPSCVTDTAPGSQGLWFTYWMRFLKAHPEVGWSFWALNGTDPRNREMPNYLLRADWQTVRLPALMTALQQIMP